MKQVTNKEYEEWLKYKDAKAKGSILMPDTIRFICAANDYNPEKIGRHFLELLPKICPSNHTNFRKLNDPAACRQYFYSKYQLDWLSSHGFEMGDIYKLAMEWYSVCVEDDIDPTRDEGFDFEAFVEERGFGNGSLWSCFGEFLGAEYLDRKYIHTLCPTEEVYELYLKDRDNMCRSSEYACGKCGDGEEDKM